MDVGIRPDEFWEMSIQEITDITERYVLTKRQEMKQTVIINEILSQHIGERVAKLFDDKNNLEITPIFDFFPGLFTEEKREAEERKRQQQIDQYKAKMTDYAMCHNAYLKATIK